ncbi:MAG: hypothetical protein D6813_10640 [Calditrichaeota bacterium]|nr:MAG: hypothetical protein D6813_10640 [Calditrichota bacterium]
MELLIALVIGLLAGLHTSTWGMYKDAPYEGFTWPKYFRSTILSASIAVVVVLITKLDVTRAPNMVVLYGFTYVIERAMVEFYKTFLREEDQSKYFIPMQFSVKGEVVENRAVRLTVGFLYLTGVLLVVYGIYTLQKIQLTTTNLLFVLAIGSVGGWISAFGGAWKDAPKEGFEILKFFRSPIIALLYALMLSNFTKNYLYISMGALGYTIGTIETYKTFFFPSKPRGKFAGKEIKYPEMLHRRQYFVPLYVAIWAIVITTIIMAFLSPREGLI